MPRFGRRSRKNLETCHKDLQRLFNEVIKYYDCAVICGYRGIEEQNKAFSEGRSKLRYPYSKHNTFLSLAVDVVPWFAASPHVRWDDKAKFYHFAGYVQGVADQLGIKVLFGGNWDMDDELHDQFFMDLPHFQLV